MDDRSLQKSDRSGLVPETDQTIWLPSPGYDTPAVPRYEDQSSHLWDYLSLIWRRRWLLLLVFAVCVGGFVYSTISKSPFGRARAQLEFILPDLSSNKPDEPHTAMPVLDIPTEVEKIQSGELAERVVLNLGLYKSLLQATSPSLSSNGAPSPEQIDVLTTWLRGRLDARQVDDTQIVRVYFVDEDPHRAAEIVNRICDEYTSWVVESLAANELQARRLTEKWLAGEIEEKGKELAEQRRQLQKFKVDHSITVSESSLEDLKEKILGTEASLAQAHRQQREAIFEFDRLTSPTTDSLAWDDSDVRQIDVKIRELERTLAGLTAEYGENYSEVKRLRLELGNLADQRAEAIKRAGERNSLERTRQLASAQEAVDRANLHVEVLEKDLKELREQALRAESYLDDLRQLTLKVQGAQNDYDDLVRKYQKTRISPFPKRSPVKVVEYASSPKTQVPSLVRGVTLGSFVGLFLGISLIVFLDYMDTKVRGPSELEKTLHLPTLGFIPKFKNGRTQADAGVDKRLIIHQQPQSAAAENFRCLRTSVQYSRAGRPPKLVLVTSALEQEGKSTVAANLAIAYAQKGKKTLLIDSDMCRPTVHKMFNVKKSPGLAEILTGKSDDATDEPAGHFRETAIRRLFILPSGSSVPNPVDLLDSDVMRDLLVLLSEEYDQVIIDSAPLLLRSDTNVLVPSVDGVALVVRSGVTPRAAARKARDRILSMQGKILGAVINNPRKGLARSELYGYGYEYGYGTAGGLNDESNGKDRSKTRRMLAEAANTVQITSSSADDGDG